MFDVFLLDLAVNENIVQICLTEVIEVVEKDIIYVLLIVDELINQFE